MFKNVATKIAVFAFTPADGLPKTGDAAQLTAYVSKDYGAVTALTDTSATEMDATNAPGWYWFDVAQAETNADFLLFTGKSSTSGVKVVGQPIHTTPNRFTSLVIDAAGLVDANTVKVGPTGSGTAQTAKDIGGAVPAAAAGASGGLLISGSNAGTTTLGALTVTGGTTLTGAVSATNASNDVRGILLQATQTGVTIPTVTTVTNQLTAAAIATGVWQDASPGDFTVLASIGKWLAALSPATIATGVWQDATAGDFTVASSIGKALYTGNVVPGGAGGLMIAGSNAATTFASFGISGDLTVTGNTHFSLAGYMDIGSLIVDQAAITKTLLINGATTLNGALNVYALTTLAGLSTGALSASSIGVSGATTLTGAVSATNAANDIRGITVGALGANVITAASMNADASTEIATTLLAAAVDGTTTVAESIRNINSATSGKASGLGTTTATYRDLADTKDRIVATVDADGNRSAVTRTLT